jgi:hypothetical protein
MKYIEPFTDINYIFKLTDEVIGDLQQSVYDNHDKIVALLKELTSHYNTGNRSVEGNTCRYKNDLGNMCAVGRCLTKDALNDFHEREATYTFAITNLPLTITEKYSSFDSMFQEKYQGIHVQVWSFLQSLHDEDDHWDEVGLSDDGRIAILNTLGTKIHNEVVGV